MSSDADSRDDRRPSRRCPICAAATSPLDTFAFPPKGDLPRSLMLECCARCDFLFAGDLSASGYRRYYASVRNDGGHVADSDGPGSDTALQLAHLADVLPAGFAGRILDVGCGQGRLLRALARRFPDASLHGHDVADHLSEDAGIQFVPDLDDAAAVPFDVVILSHVAEHLVHFDVLRTIARLLADTGIAYIEVPDAQRYAEAPRREYMYYIDRLHVNHFSARALERLLAGSGLAARRFGTHDLAYRDGTYPALYCMASRPGTDGPPAADRDGELLSEAYRRYHAQEIRRAADWKVALGRDASDGVLVYGAGDNFHRSRHRGGPLDGVRLLAIMDQRADAIAMDDGIPCWQPDVALMRYPRAPVVISVSQCSETIRDVVRARSPGRRIFFA